MVENKTLNITAGVVGALISILGIRLLRSGEFLPWYTRLFGFGAPDYPFEGKAEKEFSELEKAFREHFRLGREVGASVVVYSKSQCTAELYGGYADYKNKESVALARLVNQGLLKYDDKISDIWPEFQNDKEEVTIADLMRHEAGLTYFSEPLPKPEDLKDLTIISERLASQKHLWGGKRVRAYHAMNRGLITNEIVRRVDPKGRGLNQIYKEEFNPSLGTEFQLGLDESQTKRRSVWYQYPILDMIFIAILPSKLLGFKEVKGFNPDALKKGTPLSNYLKQRITYNKDKENSQEIAQLELPSSNGFSNAKSLAKIASVLASPKESPFFSLDCRACALDNPIEAFDECIYFHTILTQGGIGVFTFPELGSTKFYGWPGMGGSLVLFNIDYDFAFSYVMNAQHLSSLIGERVRALLIPAFKSHLNYIESEPLIRFD